MIKINEYNRTTENSRQQGKEDKPLSLPVAKTVKKAAAQEAPKPRRPRSKPKSELKPSTDYKQSVKDTFIDSTELTEPIARLLPESSGRHTSGTNTATSM